MHSFCKIKKDILPWNENPNIASIRMSKSFDRSTGRSSTDKKGTPSDSSYRITSTDKYCNKIYKLIFHKNETLSVYLSHQTTVKRLSGALWITNKWSISKVMQMTSGYKTITTIVSRTTNGKYTVIFTWSIDLLEELFQNKAAYNFNQALSIGKRCSLLQQMTSLLSPWITKDERHCLNPEFLEQYRNLNSPQASYFRRGWRMGIMEIKSEKWGPHMIC